MKQAVLIAGPTASGKSALALALAERLGGTIVNADSMQVYAGLRVITARPTEEEEARAPHLLYGHIDPAETYSTGQWLREVAQALDDIAAAGRVPIIVGGTGLYFKVLTEGIAAVPAISAEIRGNVRERLKRDGVSTLYAELIARDPVTAARLMPLDRSRIARALEVVLATGRSISDWHGENTAPLLPAERAARIFVTVERAELVSRIEARFAAMMDAGALDEVKALGARDLDPLLPAMKAHGVPWLIRLLKGDISREEAVAGSIMDTRRYAKRQHTWFRGQMKDWPMIPAGEAFDAIMRGLAA
ncbi:tRNA (adenosine(37)-N6)-dimethylallyltransferase MiaA [Undibacter mobilis]|uniref:tRNA dimethylallyltransferase n=1 Tax=Undibacter mobilis TaxID=2292256 RepID=A0A371BEJ4_9BRAD|nr:tRNA (adenosine(37)-N6)-dimethylallyltransferase MiaA [Undibacter mobilis]